MNPKSTARSLMCIASEVLKSQSNDPGSVISKLQKISSSIASGMDYEFPPSDKDKIEDWVRDNPLDAVAYVAGWTQSGIGHGDNSGWPDSPGFDWDSGLPDWDTGLKEEDGYEYRTTLVAGDAYGSSSFKKYLRDGFEFVEAFSLPAETEVWDDDEVAILYIGEGSLEIVYRRPERE